MDENKKDYRDVYRESIKNLLVYADERILKLIIGILQGCKERRLNDANQ